MTLREELSLALHHTQQTLESEYSFAEREAPGLIGTLQIRYRNALAALADPAGSYDSRRQFLSMLLGVDQAYLGSGVSWDDPLRQAIVLSEKALDRYLNQE